MDSNEFWDADVSWEKTSLLSILVKSNNQYLDRIKMLVRRERNEKMSAGLTFTHYSFKKIEIKWYQTLISKDMYKKCCNTVHYSIEPTFSAEGNS